MTIPRERGEKAEPWGPAGREARRAARAARAAAKRRAGEPARARPRGRSPPRAWGSKKEGGPTVEGWGRTDTGVLGVPFVSCIKTAARSVTRVRGVAVRYLYGKAPSRTGCLLRPLNTAAVALALFRAPPSCIGGISIPLARKRAVRF